MATIKLQLDYTLVDGASVTFKAPCNCDEVTGIKVTYPDTSGVETFKEFIFKDAHGNDLTGIGDLFVEGAYVKVVLDTNLLVGYIQNADTNAYLEAALNNKADRTLSNLTDMQKALYNIGGRPRKNLLDNPRFKVNQRGQSSYEIGASSRYGIDRWKKTGGNTITETISDDGVTFTSSEAWQVSQVFESGFGAKLEGQLLTFTVLFADGALATATGVVPTPPGEYAMVARISNKMFVRLHQNDLFAIFSGDANVTYSIKAVKLEIGEGQTLCYKDSDGNWQLYDDYDYDADLASCTFNHYQIEGGFLGKEYAEGIGVLDEVAGCAKIASGTYTGTGGYGTNNKTSITLPFVPKVLIVVGEADDSSSGRLFGFYAVHGMTKCISYIYGNQSSSTVKAIIISWNGQTVSWYSTSGIPYQLNESNKTYRYVALA